MNYDITKNQHYPFLLPKSLINHPFSPLKGHKKHPFTPRSDPFHPPKAHIIASKFHHPNPIPKPFSIPNPTFAPDTGGIKGQLSLLVKAIIQPIHNILLPSPQGDERMPVASEYGHASGAGGEASPCQLRINALSTLTPHLLILT